MRWLGRVGLGILLGSASCSQTVITSSQGRLFVSPGQVLDFGNTPVGQPVLATATFSAQRANVTIQGIDFDPSGAALFFTPAGFVKQYGDAGLEMWYALKGADVAPPSYTSLKIEAREGIAIPIDLIFLSKTADYFSSIMYITSDADDTRSQGSIPVRAHAGNPIVAVDPFSWDFGAVDQGDSDVVRITLTNYSALALTVDDLSLSANGTTNQTLFTLADPAQLPLKIPPKIGGSPSSGYFDVAFRPVQQGEPVTGSLTIANMPTVDGNGKLNASVTVPLRGNDCENGDPRAYDRDGDGYTVCAGDGGSEADCDDDNPAVHPGAREVVNGLDDDCNGIIDDKTTVYDDDGDGYCEDSRSCVGGAKPGDCNDANKNIHPGMIEDMFNGIDDDCDGVVDGGSEDRDGDGYTEAGGDWDDKDATVYPGAPEICDGKDNDQNGIIDDGTECFDDDGDGYCEGPVCRQGAAPGDCNDADKAVFPGATETPAGFPDGDGKDNNCDGRVDEGTRRYDDDGDGYSEIGGDCNDADINIAPNRYDVLGNGLDDDCNCATNPSEKYRGPGALACP